MGSLNGDIKKLTAEDVGGSDTTADNGSAGTVDSGIGPLGTAQKKTFIALCRLLPLRLFAYLAKSGATEGEWVHSFFAGASTFSKNVYPRSIFTEITFAQFEDRYYPVPVSYDVLLTQLFGQYMMKPPQQQRKIKKHAVLIDTENSYEKYQDFLKDTVFEFHTRSIR